MSEMVEWVAKALHLHQVDTGQCDPDIPWASFEGEARAAIEAMREPTNAMLTYDDGDAMVHTKCHMCGGHLEGWHLMIDAALKD